MKLEEMWNKYLELNNLSDMDYGAYEYDDLNIEKILQGKKKAEISLYDSYDNVEPLPIKGDHALVLNTSGDAICVIKNNNVRLIDFKAVKKLYKLLGYDNYEDFSNDNILSLEDDLKTMNKSLTDETIIILEEFDVVYK